MNTITTTLSDILSTKVSPLVLADFQHTYLWALIVGFILAFFVGFGMGSNDVANTFGTSVGSKVLTYRQAYILASFLTIAGAVLVGYNVTDTLRKKLIDVDLYKNTPAELLVAQVAILGAVSFWLIVTTLASAPVSSTHTVVGAIVGCSVYLKGWQGIHWIEILKIVSSWIISPLMSGSLSIILYMIIDFVVLRRRHPLKCGLRVLPIFYFCVISFLTFTVFYNGSALLHLNDLPKWAVATISIGCGLIAAIAVQFIVKPLLIKWLRNREKNQNGVNLSVVYDSKMKKIEKVDPDTTQNPKQIPYYTQPKFGTSPKSIFKWFFPAKDREEDLDAINMFRALQIFTACFGAFAFGANDISHVIASLAIILTVYHTMDVNQEEQAPVWVYFYGSIAIAVGLWCLGHKLIKTIGKRITKVNPCNGFTIEFGMALTVLLAAKAGIPISTTQCIVGSATAVGLVKSGEGVKWKMVLYTISSWILTMPASGLLAAGLMFCLKFLIQK